MWLRCCVYVHKHVVRPDLPAVGVCVVFFVLSGLCLGGGGWRIWPAPEKGVLRVLVSPKGGPATRVSLCVATVVAWQQQCLMVLMQSTSLSGTAFLLSNGQCVRGCLVLWHSGYLRSTLIKYDRDRT